MPKENPCNNNKLRIRRSPGPVKMGLNSNNAKQYVLNSNNAKQYVLNSNNTQQYVESNRNIIVNPWAAGIVNTLLPAINTPTRAVTSEENNHSDNCSDVEQPVYEEIKNLNKNEFAPLDNENINKLIKKDEEEEDP